MTNLRESKKLKIMSLALSLLLLIGCVPSAVFAVSIGDEVKVTQEGYVTGFYFDFAGYKTNITNGHYGQWSTLKTSDGKPAYCVEMTAKFNPGSGKVQDTLSKFSSQQLSYIKAALVYGYQGTTKYGQSADVERVATAAIMWAIEIGAFNSDDANFLNHAFITSGGHLNNTSTANANAAKEVYNKIKEQILSHYTVPSFTTRNKNLTSDKNYTLKWDGSKYSTTITDSNGVLENYNFTLSGVTFTKSGNKLTISTTKDLTNAVVSGERVSNKYVSKLPAISAGYVASTVQPVCFGVDLSDPVEAYFSLTTESKGSIIVLKQDAESGKTIPLAGFGFKIKNASTGKYISIGGKDTFYTDANGKISLSQTLDYGSYQLIEVAVPAGSGYVLDSTPVPFTVSNGNTVTVVKKNAPQKGTINITKTGNVFSSVVEENGMYQPVYADAGLSDTTFQIIAAEDIVTADGTTHAKKGTVVQTVTTKNGKATSKELYLGKYNIKETAVSNGFVLSTKTYSVELTYAGQNVSVTAESVSIKNERQKVNINLVKSMETDKLFNIGMYDEYKDVVFGLYADEDITAKDGKVIPKNGLIEKLTIDKNGKASVKTDLPNGKYYIKEIATNEQYILSSTKYAVDFSYTDSSLATVTIDVNEGKTIVNKIKRGNIEGLKLDEDGNALGGAVIGLFRAGEEEFTEDTALMVCETAEDGSFSFLNVAYGDYLVREISAPEAFVLNEEVYPVTISKNKEVINVEIINYFITGSVQTTKVDAEYPENKLSGAEFEVYLDVDGNGEFDPEIDTLVDVLAELEEEQGVYVLDGLRYGGYFLYEKTAPEGFLKDNSYYYFEIRENGEVAIVENEAGVGFMNQPILGSVQTTKVDSEYPENKLTGAEFEVYADVDGNGEFNPEVDVLIGELTEIEEGVYVLEHLRYGGYFLYEKTAPEGFVKDNGYYYFEIREDGQTAIVENEAGVGFTNKPIVGELEITKTDVATGKLLPNAGFRIKDADGNIVAEGRTDKNGIAKFKLRYGKYTYQEFDAPEGYQIDEKEYPFEITENGQVVKAEMTNELIPTPNTGNEKTPITYACVIAGSLCIVAGIALLLIKRKKRNLLLDR